MITLNHPSAHQIPKNDVEKWGELKEEETNIAKSGSDTFPATINTFSSDSSTHQHETPPTPVLLKGRLANWNARVEGLAGLEARGITRVLPEEKHKGGLSGYLQMFALWFSINLVPNCIITGLLGPLVFSLGWVDSVCIVIFAGALSSCGAAYISTFGPESGNRTMVCGRIESIRRTRLKLPMHHSLTASNGSDELLTSLANLSDLRYRSSVDILWDTGLQRLPVSSI